MMHESFVTTASQPMGHRRSNIILTCTISVLTKKKKNIKIFVLKIFNFYKGRRIFILHGHVTDMIKIKINPDVP